MSGVTPEEFAVNFTIHAVEHGFEKVEHGIKGYVNTISDAAKKAAKEIREKHNVADAALGLEGGPGETQESKVHKRSKLMDLLSASYIKTAAGVAVAVGLASKAAHVGLSDWAGFTTQMTQFRRSVGMSRHELLSYRQELVRGAFEYGAALKNTADIARIVGVGMKGMEHEVGKTSGRLAKFNWLTGTTAETAGTLQATLTSDIFGYSNDQASKFMDTLALLAEEVNTNRESLLQYFASTTAASQNWSRELRNSAMPDVLALLTASAQATKGLGVGSMASIIGNFDQLAKNPATAQFFSSGDLSTTLQSLVDYFKGIPPELRERSLSTMGIAKEDFLVLEATMPYFEKLSKLTDTYLKMSEKERMSKLKASMTLEDIGEAAWKKIRDGISLGVEKGYGAVMYNESLVKRVVEPVGNVLSKDPIQRLNGLLDAFERNRDVVDAFRLGKFLVGQKLENWVRSGSPVSPIPQAHVRSQQEARDEDKKRRQQLDQRLSETTARREAANILHRVATGRPIPDLERNRDEFRFEKAMTVLAEALTKFNASPPVPAGYRGFRPGRSRTGQGMPLDPSFDTPGGF